MNKFGKIDRVNQEEAKSSAKIRKLSKTCSVCAGPAASHSHYGAISCYSCRAFFRRGIGRPYCCVDGTGSCNVDWSNRRSCQWCRFDRCLRAGMKPELVDATLRRRSSVDKVTQPDGASQEILKFDLTDEFIGEAFTSSDESQIYTFVIDNISENEMMLLEPENGFVPKPINYSEERALPSLLNWGENELKSLSESHVVQNSQVLRPSENIEAIHSNDIVETFAKSNSVNDSESNYYLQSTPTSVIVKNLHGFTTEHAQYPEYQGEGIDIAALVDMCFRDED